MFSLKKNAIPHADDMSHTHFMAKNTYLKLYARVPTKVGQSHRALSLAIILLCPPSDYIAGNKYNTILVSIIIIANV